MYEVSPERGYKSPTGAADAAGAAGALCRELDLSALALGDDGAELGVHGSCLSFVDTVHHRID
jgi:hypothetical protein